jgi:alpha-amylase/alpha-mannosidase (GH57 family)
VEAQDSAFPYHDWNERITAECYGTNAFSRILDEQGRIRRILSNYREISFNFGPTLLSWLQGSQPGIYEAILQADAESMRERSGHGNAIAQCYNHVIMPLASHRDKLTQVRWGLEDFRHRFGRQPEGMWLPETAVDVPTLEVLAQEGIKFTILAPHQALRVRPLGASQWQEVNEHTLDVRRPYLVRLPSGRQIVVFFYQAQVAREVAFQGLLKSGDAFAQRLLECFGQEEEPQLVHIATDGESYGHHSRFGDMALAYCLHKIKEEGLARVSNYGEFLELHPPRWEAQVREYTSWSCAHGIERWRADCGCRQRQDWSQAWRAPLREALQWLQEELAAVYERTASGYLQEPWAARDDYIRVILDRSAESLRRFFSTHALRELTSLEQMRLLKLLEIQRHGQLMFTSCGWFFDDISGLEAVQILQYAARAIQLHEELYGDALEEEFLRRLEAAQSNLGGTGRDVYLRHVRPRRVDLRRVAVHYAISSLFEDYPQEATLYCYDVQRLDYERLEAAKAELATGMVKVRSRVTLEEDTLSFAVLRLGDHDINCGLSTAQEEPYGFMKAELLEAFQKGAFSDCLRLMDHHLGMHTYNLMDLFWDERRKVLSQTIRQSVEEFEHTGLRLYQESKFLMGFLRDAGMPIPRVFLSVAEFALNAALKKALKEEPLDVHKAETLWAEMKEFALPLEAQEVEFLIRQRLGRMLKALREHPSLEGINLVREFLGFVFTLPLEVNLWEPQNIYYEMATELSAPEGPEDEECLEAFRHLGEVLNFNVQEVFSR